MCYVISIDRAGREIPLGEPLEDTVVKVIDKAGREIPLGEPLEDTVVKVIDSTAQQITHGTGKLWIGKEFTMS